ncbi:MAG: glucose 1-dehydrogenase [Acidobacteria bacterium]|nr:glucose 1-dehydrogenase [Acidobacteriota bacterium]
MRLKDKTAIITGSSQGIGRGIAERFAREGANVVINYIGNIDMANEVKSNVESLGGRAIAVKGDVSKIPDIENLFAAAIAEFGKVDILVNNAGVERHAPFVEVSEMDYDFVMDVNVKGTFFAAQAMAKHLIGTKRRGKIINISSVHEDLPFPNFTAYCVSKGGIRMLTRNLAVELGQFGINVNNIAPGAIETPINRNLLNDPMKLQYLLGQIPLNRLGNTDDVAGVGVFLASNEADYVTGSTFFVDGGLTWFYEEQ